MSGLFLTSFFIQAIYYHVKSRHPVSSSGSCSQVTFFVGYAAFFIQPIYIYIYIYISNWICKNKAPESITFFMQFGLKKKKKKKKEGKEKKNLCSVPSRKSIEVLSGYVFSLNLPFPPPPPPPPPLSHPQVQLCGVGGGLVESQSLMRCVHTFEFYFRTD